MEQTEPALGGACESASQEEEHKLSEQVASESTDVNGFRFPAKKSEREDNGTGKRRCSLRIVRGPGSMPDSLRLEKKQKQKPEPFGSSTSFSLSELAKFWSGHQQGMG